MKCMCKGKCKCSGKSPKSKKCECICSCHALKDNYPCAPNCPPHSCSQPLPRIEELERHSFIHCDWDYKSVVTSDAIFSMQTKINELIDVVNKLLSK